jgi:adenine phosphoribosyltransferase
MDYYDFKFNGITRRLPLIQVGRNTRLASFSILGDVELVDTLADKMSAKLKKYEFDYLVGPEVRVLPLIHGVAKRLHQKRYVVCRETIKSYMINPVVVKPLSHFPKHVKPLVLNGPDAELIKNKKVVIIDDVVSTGVTIRMIKYLMKKVNATVVECFAAVKQGEQFDDIENLEYLGELPIFKTPS